MSILNLGVLNSIKKGIDTLIKGGGKNINSQYLTLAPGVQTTTNVFDISDVNAIIAIKQLAVTPGGIECVIRYHDENGDVIFVGETIKFSAQSIYEQAEIILKSTRVSFRLTNKGSANKALTIALSKSISYQQNVVNLFDFNSLELTPGEEVFTKTFEFDTDSVRIGFYGLSGTFPANLEITARYTTPTGDTDYVFLDPGIVTEVKNGYNEGILYKLKHRKVSFRFRNMTKASFTLSRIVASKVSYTPLSPVQQLFTDNVISLEPEDRSNVSNILEVDADYGVIGMYGFSGSFPAVVEITPRYHGRDTNVIHVGDPILVNVGSRYTGKVAAVVPMIHKRVSFRIVNKSPETISIAQAVISPRDTDPNGNSLNLGILNSIKNGVNSLGKGTNSQTLTLEPGVETATNIFDVSDVNAIIAIRLLDEVTAGGIECAIRYHDEGGNISFVGEIINFSTQSAYEQKEIQLKASRVSFRLTNNGEVNKILTLTLSKTAAPSKNISNEINVVSLFNGSIYEFTPNAITDSTETYEFDTDYVRIGFYGHSGAFPSNLEIIARYTTPLGDTEYGFIDSPQIITVKSGYNEGILFKLKYRKVSFRFRNISPESFTLSRIVASKSLNADKEIPLSTDESSVLTRGKPVQHLFDDNLVVLEPADITIYSNILEIDADYGVIGMYGFSGSFPAVVEITPRYHGRDDNIIYIGDPILVNVGSMYTGKVAAVVPMIHKRVSFRIVNKSPETISIAQAVISPRDTDPNGNNLNFPLSPDGAMLVQLMDGVDSGAFDSFYGSLKSLRTYKNDFKLIVTPPTEKKDTVSVTEEFNLQDGVEQLRLYLKITVTGNPFQNTEDGANLVVKLKDDDFEVFSVTGDKLSASGYNLIVFGDKELSDLAIERLKTIPTIFGDSVNVALQVTGTFDETNYITYEIISYQKFK